MLRGCAPRVSIVVFGRHVLCAWQRMPGRWKWRVGVGWRCVPALACTVRVVALLWWWLRACVPLVHVLYGVAWLFALRDAANGVIARVDVIVV